MGSQRKERGAFFTPPAIAKHLTDWAVQSPRDTVLDPGAGDGEFLRSALARLIHLGADRSSAVKQVWGIEIDPESAGVARKSLKKLTADGTPKILTSDMFDVGPETTESSAFGYSRRLPLFDAVVGNPPYVRYHSFKGEARKKGLSRARSLGVDLPALSSLWAPYVVHALSFLRRGGRVAMVLPAELLTVDYGQHVRDYLLGCLHQLTITAFEERVFPEVLEDVVLLKGSKVSGEEGLEVIRIRNAARLADGSEPLGTRLIPRTEGIGQKWTRFLLSPDIDANYHRIAEMPEVSAFGTVAAVDIGVVTGKNDFFILDETEAESFGIEEDHLVPILTTSRSLRGLTFGHADFEDLREHREKCLLLDCHEADAASLSSAVRSYLSRGVKMGVPSSYKTRGRSPWYSVPSVYSPDAFLSYMSSSWPKLVLNEAEATCTNSVHRVRFRTPHPPDTVAFAASWHNTLTMLSGELVGRSYGGGVLKHETKEAESILTVPPRNEVSGQLNRVSGKLDTLLRSGSWKDAVEIVDEILLEGQLGLPRKRVERLSEGLLSLQSRRFTRMKKGVGD